MREGKVRYPFHITRVAVLSMKSPRFKANGEEQDDALYIHKMCKCTVHTLGRKRK